MKLKTADSNPEIKLAAVPGKHLDTLTYSSTGEVSGDANGC